jgi:hypothetical protein
MFFHLINVSSWSIVPKKRSISATATQCFLASSVLNASNRFLGAFAGAVRVATISERFVEDRAIIKRTASWTILSARSATGAGVSCLGHQIWGSPPFEKGSGTAYRPLEKIVTQALEIVLQPAAKLADGDPIDPSLRTLALDAPPGIEENRFGTDLINSSPIAPHPS